MAKEKKVIEKYFNRNVRHNEKRFTTNSKMKSTDALYKDFEKKGYLSEIAPNMVVLESGDNKELSAKITKLEAELVEAKEANEELLTELNEAKEAIKILKSTPNK